jgi:hypothetical protein
MSGGDDTPTQQDGHGIHCPGCRELALITQHGEAIAAAKAAFAELPPERRAVLDARFDLARMEAQHHATYGRPL